MSDTPPTEALSAELFAAELRAALRSYERQIVCIEQVPEEMEAALQSLLEKAILAYQNRAPGLKHGIALNRQVTVILSESPGPKPLCGIYFNLHSPYARRIAKSGSSKASP